MNALLQELLEVFAGSLRLVAEAGAGPGTPIRARLDPDPITTGLGDAIGGLSRTSVVAKMLRLADTDLPTPSQMVGDNKSATADILGPQPMQALSVDLPLSLGTTTVPSLTQPTTTSPDDLLAGVPAALATIESGRIGLHVSLRWTFAIEDGPTVSLPLTAATLNVLPPMLFTELGADPSKNMTISVTGRIWVPDPQDATKPLASVLLVPPGTKPTPRVATVPVPEVTVQFSSLSIPRVLALFTWPSYGTQPSVVDGRGGPMYNSVLLVCPMQSPGISAVLDALRTAQAAAQSMLSVLSLPLDATMLVPFAVPLTAVGQLTALLSGIGALLQAVSVVGVDDYTPVGGMQSLPTGMTSPDSGVADLTGPNTSPGPWWWDHGAGDYENYHDNARSFLWLAPPGGQAVIYRDKNYKYTFPNKQGMLTLTTGSTCLAGIPHFRMTPDGLDKFLSPDYPGFTPASADLQGYFTNDDPPKDEKDWAWTDSLGFNPPEPPTPPPPIITSVVPNFGKAAGGDAVTVQGLFLSGATSVSFGQATGTGLTVVSDSELTVTNPPGQATADVSVTTPSGVSASTPADRFTYT